MSQEPLPQLVRSRVAFARRGLASVRVLQSLCCAATVAALSLAAGLNSGGRLAEGALWVAASVNALLVAVAAALAFRRSPAEVARRIDATLEQGGALFTAWEVEGRGQGGALAERLAREVAARVSARDTLRAAMPRAGLYLALPFLAAALLFGALEERRSGTGARDLQALVGQVEAGLQSLSELGSGAVDEGGASLDPAQREELRRLLARAGALAEQLAEEQAAPEELEALERDLARFEEALQTSEPARRELQRSRVALDAARMALEERGESSAESARPTEAPGGAGASRIEGPEGRALAPGAGIGRMGRPELRPSGSSGPDREARREAGVLGRPSWPPAHEAILRRWVELQRGSDPDR